MHNDFDDHDMCPDCKGSGQYIGLNIIEKCDMCEGAGWVQKGSGLKQNPQKNYILNKIFKF